MLSISSDGTIKLTRGDTARLTVNITNDADSAEYTIQSDDVLTMTVKKNINDSQPAIQKTITGTNTFHIEPKDTSGLAFGRYTYDVQLNASNGDVFTVIEPSTFELAREVTC